MDSSGEYIKLRFPLLPKKRNERLTRQDWEQALLVQPMAKIPDILVPGCGPRGIPPRLHFGWVLDDDGNRLLDIAREKKIEPRDQREVKLLPKDDSDDEDIYEGPSVKMNELWLKQDALSAVGKELQLICEPYLDQVCCPGKRTVKIVGLIDNYSLKSQVVGRADIPKLVDYFNFDVGPLWFLDSYRWTWNID
ncbi:hypothetical protein SCHPADRAFT_369483 [Schizopora paradoxa]|uniref:Uncharacterized protein n=1 Tax=Schizopora paradoxa TaxID=27342 RepID=A0A0H2RNZ5_9AGAM|nr:hypothetical protein SCHPADRAFT_369483 [Schizopora paradoxa]